MRILYCFAGDPVSRSNGPPCWAKPSLRVSTDCEGDKPVFHGRSEASDTDRHVGWASAGSYRQLHAVPRAAHNPFSVGQLVFSTTRADDLAFHGAELETRTAMRTD